MEITEVYGVVTTFHDTPVVVEPSSFWRRLWMMVTRKPPTVLTPKEMQRLKNEAMSRLVGDYRLT
jgi:hypothetical protein